MAHLRETFALPATGPASSDDEADWVVLDLHGRYPTHTAGNALMAMLRREETFEHLTERLQRLGRARWLAGVLVRVGEVKVGLATARAIGAALGRLSRRTRVVGYLPQVSMRTLLITAELAEVVAPPSAEVMLPGFAAEQVYLGAFLAKHGIGFENLRIREYKTALSQFSSDHMDSHEREQLSAYISSAERTWLQAVADGAEPAAVFDAALAGAEDLLAAGLLTRVAYEDEIVTIADPPWGRVIELVVPARKRRTSNAEGVAVVPIIGAIVPGRSRPAPPVPLMPGPLAGADTVVARLRKAERDEKTAAIVLYVDSPGGSALASDLIGRAVARCRKPVVAVMGEVAASGGYYVLCHADHIVANPFTLTGSIGVVAGKPVLAGFNHAHGFNPETVGRDLALFNSPHRPFSPAQRDWAQTMMARVYDRFVGQVARGRDMSPEQVDAIARGRIWSGRDARDRGLVDELGDFHHGVGVARRLAGLAPAAPVRTVSSGFLRGGMPTFGQAVISPVQTLWPFGSEKVLTWYDRSVRIR